MLLSVLYLWFSGTSLWASLVAQMVKKKSACNEGDLGLIPGSGRSPGKGNCYPFQYSRLENSMGELRFLLGPSQDVSVLPPGHEGRGGGSWSPFK